MQTFKVVLDGIELSEEQTREIAVAVQETVIRELSAHDALFVKGEEDSSELSMLSILKGIIAGGIMGFPESRGSFQELKAKEFGG
jgi:hypothetical protein